MTRANAENYTGAQAIALVDSIVSLLIENGFEFSESIDAKFQAVVNPKKFSIMLGNSEALKQQTAFRVNDLLEVVISAANHLDESKAFEQQKELQMAVGGMLSVLMKQGAPEGFGVKEYVGIRREIVRPLNRVVFYIRIKFLVREVIPND